MVNDTKMAPPVVKWYRVYCAFMLALYLVCLVGVILVLFLFRHDLGARFDADVDTWVVVAYLGVFFIISSLLAGAYLVSFFLQPQSGAWVYHLVLICIGLTSPCLMPVSIPLLIFWIRPDTRLYFGRT